MLKILIFIPLIPALPVLATWFLPWERWIPRIVPKKIIGPYLLYCTFAAWYFKMPWWTVLIFGAFGAVVSAIAFYETKRDNPSMQ